VDGPLDELLAALSEHTPAPGGGSAAAWTGAMAAALLQMAAAYADADETAERAAALRAELVELGERELHSYEPVLAAQRMPAADPSRAERIASALSEASQSPLAIARAGAEVADLAAGVAEQSKPALAGDAVVAVLLAEAATRAAGRLVEINLRGRSGDPRLAEVGELADRAARARERALGAS